MRLETDRKGPSKMFVDDGGAATSPFLAHRVEQLLNTIQHVSLDNPERADAEFGVQAMYRLIV